MADVDMSQFVEAKSDELTADDLLGGPRTVVITAVVGAGGDRPVTIRFEGDNGKPFKPCKTVRRVLLGAWGPHCAEYIGRSMTLYRDPEVTYGGLQTGGVRISHLSNISQEKVIVVQKSKGQKVAIKVRPLATGNDTPFTLRNAAQLLADATTMDELQAAWKQKRMAPHREALQSDLDARKAELSVSPNAEEKRGKDDFGEAFSGAEGQD